MKSYKPYKSIEEWLKLIDACFPTFRETLSRNQINAVIIGAALLDVYPIYGYPISPTRRTTDLDVSISIGINATEYECVREALFKVGYERKDTSRMYRLYAPHLRVKEFHYIDLLAHPGTNGSAQRALDAMGITGDWNFQAIDFALTDAIPITAQLQIPNILSFLTMKAMSWQEDPYRRAKDLGDVVDIVYSLVSSGSHYQITDLARKTSLINPLIISRLKSFLKSGGEATDISLDFEDFLSELIPRGYSAEFITDNLPQYFREIFLVFDE